MKSLCVLPVALAMSAPLHADLVPTVFGRLARDSAEVRSLYGATVFANPASRVGIQVAEPGVLRFIADTLRSEATEGFSTKVGLVLPVAHRVEPRNLTGIEFIRFDLKLSEIPEGGVRISIRSKGYGGTYDLEGKTYGHLLHPAVLPPPGTWKTFSIDIAEFDIPTSWVPEASYPLLDSILMVPEGLQFSPLTLYHGDGIIEGEGCSRCVDPTTTRLEMEIREVRLVGGLPPAGLSPLLSREGCPDVFFHTLDDFRDGNATNLFGGTWTVGTDTSSGPSRTQDSALGTSAAWIEVQGAEGGSEHGSLRFHAALRKKAVMDPYGRPDAAWAELSTDFGQGAYLDGRYLTAISFRVRMRHAGPHVRKLLFKVPSPGVPSDRLHQVEIALPYLHPDSAWFQSILCVRTEDLKQPYWVVDRKPFRASYIPNLIWEVPIGGEDDPRAISDSVDLLLSDVRVYNWDFSMHVERWSVSFPVFYRSGRLTVEAPWAGSEVLVVSPSGRIAARFMGKVQGERLSLERGAWKVVVRNAQGQRLVRTIAVLR